MILFTMLLYALQSTIQRSDESKESLSNANLQLTVERQEAQLTLLACLLLLVVKVVAPFSISGLIVIV